MAATPRRQAPQGARSAAVRLGVGARSCAANMDRCRVNASKSDKEIALGSDQTPRARVGRIMPRGGVMSGAGDFRGLGFEAGPRADGSAAARRVEHPGVAIGDQTVNGHVRQLKGFGAIGPLVNPRAGTMAVG